MRPILLPRPSDMNWAHVYRNLASEADIHAITQRADAGKTALIMDIARDRLPSAASVLDIGCGDGRLLHSINAEVRIGTVISEEEASRLRHAYRDTDIEFHASDIETLDMGRTFDLVCVVGVLQHLTSHKAARKALMAVSKTVNQGGHVYIGDFTQLGVPPKRYTSTLRAIGFVRRTSGTAKAIGFIGHLWKRRHRMGSYEAPRLPQYAASADDFIRLASECGFSLVQKWTCSDFGVDDGRLRMDYLFRVG